MTAWQRFKRSCGPMDKETTKRLRPIAWAMMFNGGLKIVGFCIWAIVVYH